MANIERNNGTIRARSLDDFPEHLLLYILTFLPTLEAVRSSVLSRKWRNLWSSVASLDFDYFLFPPIPDSPSDTRRRFAAFVDETLIRRSRTPILKFRFQFDIDEYFYWPHVDSWIQYAIDHNAIELDIELYNRCAYDFNFRSLKNSRVRDLRVSRCDLLLPCNMSSLKFDSIRSLYLEYVHLTDQWVVDLISGCVNLESLCLYSCFGMKRLRICSSKLKELSLWYFDSREQFEGEEESLEISCPNLSSISICNFQMGEYCIKDSTSLVEAQVDFFHQLDNYSYWSKVVRLFSGIKRLKVQNWWFKLLGEKDASLDRFAFKNLNHLELQTNYKKHDFLGIAALLEICPNITTLTLDELIEIDLDELIEIDEYEWLSEELLNGSINFSIPNLKILKLKRSRGKKNEMELVSLMKKHGAALEKIVVCHKDGGISFPLEGCS